MWLQKYNNCYDFTNLTVIRHELRVFVLWYQKKNWIQLWNSANHVRHDFNLYVFTRQKQIINNCKKYVKII